LAIIGLFPAEDLDPYLCSSLEKSGLNTVYLRFDGLLPLLMKSSVVAMYFPKRSGLGISSAWPI
jgi:hypothetical protein